MIVDFPEPEGPTRAIVFPASKVQVKSFKTLRSGRVGYVKFTFLNYISPFNSSFLIDFKFLFVVSLILIVGSWSIISKAKWPATLPSEIAVTAGVAPVNPREPNITQKMTDMITPPV